MLLKKLIGGSMVAKRKDKDPGFYSMYVDAYRKSEGGCDRTWKAMDKDRFYVSKQLYSTLHGCIDPNTALTDMWRVVGKHDYDPADFKGPCFIYHGDMDNTNVPENGEYLHKAVS